MFNLKRPVLFYFYSQKRPIYNYIMTLEEHMFPIYENRDTFESALEKAWKSYNDSGSRTVDSCEDDYIECCFSKGFREGYLFAIENMPKWKTVEENTTKRTAENDCVNTEHLLVKGWIDKNDFRIVEPYHMINRQMICIPTEDLKKLLGYKE